MRPTVLLDRIMRPCAQLILLAVLWLTGTAPAVFAAMWAAPYLPATLLAGVRAAAGTSRAATQPARRPPPGRAARIAPRLLAVHRARERWPAWPRLALQRVDVLLVAALAGLAPAAIYAVAGRFVVLGQFANQGISQSVQPRLAERSRSTTGSRANHALPDRRPPGWCSRPGR